MPAAFSWVRLAAVQPRLQLFLRQLRGFVRHAPLACAQMLRDRASMVCHRQGQWSAHLARADRGDGGALLPRAGGRRRRRCLSESPPLVQLTCARRAIAALRGHQVNSRSHHLLAFVVAGLFAGFAGSLFAFLKGACSRTICRVDRSSPRHGSPRRDPSAGRAPIGAAAFKTGHLVTLYTEYWQAFLGGVLLVVVLAFPNGIMGLVRRRREAHGERHG
jgi:hypothetical protein